jgi:predicted TIM-barrel fold metal-dependent hydrolase
MKDLHIVDGDGHVFEDTAGIGKHMPDLYKERGELSMDKLFPPLDHLHHMIGRLLPEAFGGGKPVDVPEWRGFMDYTRIERAVLFPTRALSYGNIVDPDWAIFVARAYNNWLYETYMQVDARFQGLGLLPMQEPGAAVEELRRIVKDLGMRGGMLPSNGLKGTLGSKEYWPVFSEAERLGCCLAIHGGAHGRMGLDYLNPYAGVHALGHPFGQMIQFSSIVLNGIFDKFPKVRVAFLEGGVAWFLLCLERLDRSYATHIPYDPRSENVQLKEGEAVSDYIRAKVKAGNIFIGCEGEEPDLAHAVRTVGEEPWVFSSDYPHEVSPASCKHEIEEVLESEELAESAKEAILWRNAERLYALKPLAAEAQPVAARA